MINFTVKIKQRFSHFVESTETSENRKQSSSKNNGGAHTEKQTKLGVEYMSKLVNKESKYAKVQAEIAAEMSRRAAAINEARRVEIARLSAGNASSLKMPKL